MTDQELRALAAAAIADDKRAAPGPWTSKGYGFAGPTRGIGFCHGFQDDAAPFQRDTGTISAEIIAAARTRGPALAKAVLELLDRVAEAERELAEYKEEQRDRQMDAMFEDRD